MFPGLQSGHLLSSIKSRCQCCGRELIDPHDVPEELLAHGVQVRILVIFQNPPELVLKELPMKDLSRKNQGYFIKYSFQFFLLVVYLIKFLITREPEIESAINQIFFSMGFFIRWDFSLWPLCCYVENVVTDRKGVRCHFPSCPMFLHGVSHSRRGVGGYPT